MNYQYYTNIPINNNYHVVSAGLISPNLAKIVLTPKLYKTKSLKIIIQEQVLY